MPQYNEDTRYRGNSAVDDRPQATRGSDEPR
jgi:hypothetical protein